MKQITLIKSMALIFLSALVIPSFAADSSKLKLKSAEYTLVPNIGSVHASDLRSSEYNGEFYVIVHFKTIPTQEVKSNLLQHGVRLGDYLPDNSFMAFVNTNSNLAGLQEFGITGVYLVSKEFKMSYNLANGFYPDHIQEGTKVKIVVQNHAVSSQKLTQIFTEVGAEILGSYGYSNLTTLKIKSTQISRLASHPLIKYMEEVAPDPTPEDIQGQSNHRMNYISNPMVNTIPFNGSGVWLAVGDDGELGPHIDYAGRMDQSSVGASSGDHGDHVAGIMMGAGNVDPEARGMAWGADIKVYDVWDAVNSTPTSYINPGVVVTSTSYGNGCNAGYTSFAQTADQQIRQMPNLMHVFSAGNSGTSNCGYGAGSGWGNITGGIKAGKNVLAVGNVTTTDVLASSSSRGPASDGRIKPDICANGTQVYSCLPNNQYVNNTGTSMAAPGVSGTYGALVQAYRELNGGVTPSSDLVKGAMLNTADDLGNVGPDFKFGWGRLNARKVVQVFENNTFMLDSLSQGGSNQHTISVPSGVSELKVMVYWNDYEGSTSSSLALVNNLDMTVTDPGSVSLLPYILDSSPNSTSLNTPATHGVDNLNNMEQVVVTDPAQGNFVVNITGTSIPQGPQKYYVIYEFITNEVIVTYPIGGEGLKPGNLEKIRWDASTGTQNFDVEYSIDNGVNWLTLSNVGSTTRQVSFLVPNVVSGQCLVRVTRNGISGQSILPFSIIDTPGNIDIYSSCPNSFQVNWDPVVGATHYEVSVLGNKYMDSVTTVTDTFAIVSGYSSAVSHWVSVKAKTADAIGRRAIAIEKASGIWNCALDNDVAISLESPSSPILSDCIDHSATMVSVKLVNNGINSVSNIALSMQFNQGTSVQEIAYGVVLPGDSTYFTFSQSISITGAPSSHDLRIWKDVADDNPLNDSIFSMMTLYANGGISLPYSTSFQNQTTCSVATNCGQTICNLTEWVNAENGVGDDIDFRVNAGSTASGGTGPTVGHTNGNASDKYIYLEASGSCEFNQSDLYTPCFDLTQTVSPKAKVWYHMNGTEMGELHFDVFANSMWNLDYVLPITGNQGSLWQEHEIDLSAFAGQSGVIIRYRGITGSTFRSDIALDDFTIQETGYGILADDESCISNSSIVISNTTIPGGANYSWDFGAGATPSSASGVGPHSVSYSSAGLKMISLSVDVNGVAESLQKQINVVDIPVVSFAYANPLSNGKVAFTNTSNSLMNSFWEFDDGATSYLQDPSHTYAMGGNYNVSLTVENGCGPTTSTQQVNVGFVGVGENNYATMDWLIFPNPTGGMVQLKINGEVSNGLFKVYDIKGQLVFTSALPNTNQGHTESINLSFLSKGVYMLNLSSDGMSEMKRLIIQ